MSAPINQKIDASRQIGGAVNPIWVVACILVRKMDIIETTVQTISWRQGCTENEAKGAAVTYALEQKPGFSISMITQIEFAIP